MSNESFGPQGAPISVPADAPPREQAAEQPAEDGPLSDGCFGQHTPMKNLNCTERRKPADDEVVTGAGAPMVVKRDPDANTVEVRSVSQFVGGEPGETMSTEEFEARGGSPAPIASESEPGADSAEGAAAIETLRRVKALLPQWEEKAATTLLKSEYQKGQRIATLSCADDLRNIVGD